MYIYNQRIANTPLLAGWEESTIPYSGYLSDLLSQASVPRAAGVRYWRCRKEKGDPRATRQSFRFVCTKNCLPFANAAKCSRILQRAICQAIRLAAKAADMLKHPRNPVIDLMFHQVFGHSASQAIPWAGNSEPGDIVAWRFWQVEQALRQQTTFYRCDSCTTTTSDDPPAGSIVDVHALAFPATKEVWLCPSFWRLPEFQKAAVILHEMLHLVFSPLFDHGPNERKNTNAYCYEVFALRVNGRTPEQIAVNKCISSPI
ncbi:MAG: hypothetical protein HUU32_05915 [Calditrichaceae bacterium]|nr:hypothetical protein [Calditrichia bacterium]NUQ40913.1 hypothetical protein [Calditrichaceae bacterium]